MKLEHSDSLSGITWTDKWHDKGHMYILPDGYIEGETSSALVSITVKVNGNEITAIIVPTRFSKFRYNITSDILSTVDKFMEYYHDLLVSNAEKNTTLNIVIEARGVGQTNYSKRTFRAILGSGSDAALSEDTVKCSVIRCGGFNYWHASLSSHASKSDLTEEQDSLLIFLDIDGDIKYHKEFEHGYDNYFIQFKNQVDEDYEIAQIQYRPIGRGNWITFVPEYNNYGHLIKYYDIDRGAYDTVASEALHTKEATSSEVGYIHSSNNTDLPMSIGRQGEETYTLRFRGDIYNKLKMLMTSHDVSIGLEETDSNGEICYNFKPCIVSGKIESDKTGYVNTELKVKIENTPTLILR